MNLFKKISYILGIGALSLQVTACSDPGDELTSVEFDRLFTPTSFEVKVQNKVDFRLLWECRSHAESFTVQLFANDAAMNFEGTPTLEYTDVKESPYIIKGLDSETTYAVRIKAVGNGKESHWATASAATAAEQIFEAVSDDNITGKSVTLHWPAGSAVTTIEITGGKTESYTLSAAEKAAGEATISGLEYETAYTFTIMNGSKARGTVKVTTMPNYIPAYPGDDLQALIDNAAEGETVMLLPAKDGSTSDFIYLGEDSEPTTLELTISKGVAVKCLGTKPVKARIKFVLNGTNSFTTENIFFTGVSSDALVKLTNCTGTITMNKIEATGYGNLIVEPGETVSVVDEINITNSYFHKMCTSKRFIDSQKKKTAVRVLNMHHCTVANSCTGSDFIRFDYFAAQQGLVINFYNNTLYKVEATSKGLFYVRSNAAGDKYFTANIERNIFAECSEKVFFSQAPQTDNLLFSNNYYFNAPSLLTNPEGGAGRIFDTTGQVLDPEFKDAANGDFTIQNETLLDKNIGNIAAE